MYYDSDFSQYIIVSDWDAIKTWKKVSLHDSDTNLNHTL